jgi:hypothetical protein
MEGVSNGINQAKKRGKEKHKEGGICRQEKTHDWPFAKVRAHGAGQTSFVSSSEEKKILAISAAVKAFRVAKYQHKRQRR